METKKCNRCNEFKLFTDFHKHKTTKDRLFTYCKTCSNAQTKNAKHLARYGMTTEQIDKHKEKGCELCGSTNNLHVDHNHDTGEFRGILCTNCNRGLGHFMDSAALLSKAVEYLQSKGSYNRWQT